MPNPSGSTAEYGFPYPFETDIPDVSTAIQVLAQAVENLIKQRVGTIQVTASTTLPTDALWCHGQAVSRTTYASLFAAVGTAFGAGDGSTTFNVPDLRGRAPIGSGQGTGLSDREVGQTGGSETVMLSVEEMPTHSHTITPHSHKYPHTNPQSTTEWEEHETRPYGMPSTIAGTASAVNTLTAFTNAHTTGGGAAHNNMQPYTVVNYVIWYR